MLKDKNIIVTGATRGLGFEIAKQCLKNGANIFISGTSTQSVTDAYNELCVLSTDTQKVYGQVADISSEADCINLVYWAVTKFDSIDGLVNNAGIYGPKGALEAIEAEDWIRAINVNLIGTMLMCKEVLSLMKIQKSGSIVNLSGGGATAPMPYLSAYAASKAGVVRFTETLALEVTDCNLKINAVAPGALNTRMLTEILEAGPEKVGQAFYARSLAQEQEGGASIENAAELIIYLLSGKAEVPNGKLISAVWDDWKDEQFSSIASKPDVFTLRRVKPGGTF